MKVEHDEVDTGGADCASTDFPTAAPDACEAHYWVGRRVDLVRNGSRVQLRFYARGRTAHAPHTAPVGLGESDELCRWVPTGHVPCRYGSHSDRESASTSLA